MAIYLNSPTNEHYITSDIKCAYHYIKAEGFTIIDEDDFNWDRAFDLDTGEIL